jgi:hypothetical protein
MNKKTMPLFTGIAVIVLITGAVTFAAGMLTGRWVPPQGLEEARTSLKELPLEISHWHADENRDLDPTSVKMLRIQDSYINRTYKNTKTNKVVHMTMMVGPAGKITVHNPVVCFGGKDYEKDAAQVVVQFDIPPEDPEFVDKFWRVSFTGRSLDTQNRISFYYAISAGDSWNAVENPRSTYSNYRYVYKLQVEAYSSPTDDVDTVRDFLTDCLPTIHNHLRPCK